MQSSPWSIEKDKEAWKSSAWTVRGSKRCVLRFCLRPDLYHTIQSRKASVSNQAHLQTVLLKDGRSRHKALKMSAETQHTADDAVRRLEEWSDRFFQRVVVFILFGQIRKHDFSDPGSGSTDENHKVVAVRRV